MASSHTVLPKFDASDTWQSYSRGLEKYFEVNGVLNDNERNAVLLSVLSPSVYKVLRDSCKPELPRLKTYAELSELLNIQHSPQPSVFKQRIEFYGATQTPGESVSKWLARLVRLATFCDFGNQLDTVVKDNFVAGLANQSVVRKLCEEISSSTLEDLVDSAEKYELLYRTDCEPSILVLPDDVLRQIILLLTARERVPLGTSCQRFKALVFEDPALVKFLDFSRKPGLTTMSQIQKYFDSKTACQHVLKVNAGNVACMKAGDQLNNSIRRGINLVEVNLHGTKFEDIWQLGSFLNELRHLEKLYIDWPTTSENDISLCRHILRRPFSKLKYLSVRFAMPPSKMFINSLSLCQQLEELYMQELNSFDLEMSRNSWNSKIKHLTNLKIVQYYGIDAITVQEELEPMLPNRKRWTDFQLCGPVYRNGFYIEKDVDVCEELQRSERFQEIMKPRLLTSYRFSWSRCLDPECLLKEALRITHQDVPENLCCLLPEVFNGRRLLKVHEAKLLLKDPRSQISCLYVKHSIERLCGVHLLASAFPNLSELVLGAISTENQHTSRKNSYVQRHLSRRGSPVPEKQDFLPNRDSSFKMLVGNTPNLRHFTLDPSCFSAKILDKDWDLGALSLISGWQNLETLHMNSVPCEDGRFLIEIVKRCKKLQKLSLERICNTDLSGILKYCRNLRDFTIRECDIDQAKTFATLANNERLEKVQAINKETQYPAAPWISALKKIVRQCPKLTTIVCETGFGTEDDLNEAVSAVKRIKEECRRPDFEIKVNCLISHPQRSKSVVVGTAVEDFPQNEPFPAHV